MLSKKYILTKEEVLELISEGVIIQRIKEDSNSYCPLDLAIEVFNRLMVCKG